jgi:ectoine hydroxylase-related dioxygenase (phytanoyl-CoA dioxygenase family)
MSAKSLTTQQVDEFFDLGWTVLPDVFSPAEVAEIGSALDRITEEAKQFSETSVFRGTQFVVEGARIDRVVWVGGIEPCLLNYSSDERLLHPVSQLLGIKSMQQLVCQFHPKLPQDTVKFDWHQDSQHRGYGTSDWTDINGKGSYVQTLTAIDPVELDNGPVFFVPHSGKRGHLSLDRNDVKDFVDLQRAVPLLLQPGSVAFFGPYVVHGSYPNESDKPRRVFINGYAYPGANKKQYPGEGSGRWLSSRL